MAKRQRALTRVEKLLRSPKKLTNFANFAKLANILRSHRLLSAADAENRLVDALCRVENGDLV